MINRWISSRFPQTLQMLYHDFFMTISQFSITISLLRFAFLNVCKQGTNLVKLRGKIKKVHG